MELGWRNWTAADAENFYELACTPGILERMNPDFPRTPEACKALLETFAASEERDSRCCALLVDGEVAGSLGLFPEGGDRAKVAYWLGEAFWRRGIMTAALRGFCAECFVRYGLCSITAEPHADNLASQKTLLKVGFGPRPSLSGTRFVLEPQNLCKNELTGPLPLGYNELAGAEAPLWGSEESL